MKRIILMIFTLTAFLLISCSKTEKQSDVFSKKTFTSTNNWGETETYEFSDDGTACFTIKTKSVDSEYNLSTYYKYTVDEESETVNFMILKYPFLQEDNTYISLDYNELLQRDPEGKEAYDDVFSQIITYKYVLFPKKLVFAGEFKNQEYNLVK